MLFAAAQVVAGMSVGPVLMLRNWRVLAAVSWQVQIGLEALAAASPSPAGVPVGSKMPRLARMKTPEIRQWSSDVSSRRRI